MKIGIGITTRNRRNIAERSIWEWKHHTDSARFKLAIVDDASDIPYPGADFRFEENVGIATAKNKCLELLEDCDFIFLSDDDFFPTNFAWYLPYTLSDLNHACYTFGRTILKTTKDYISFIKPCGCLLFFRKICLDVVGGFNPEFVYYSYEHVNLSDRIYNADLTPARYIDVPDSMNYFRSLDQYEDNQSSVPRHLRAAGIQNNTPLLEKYKDIKQYIPYK